MYRIFSFKYQLASVNQERQTYHLIRKKHYEKEKKRI